METSVREERLPVVKHVEDDEVHDKQGKSEKFFPAGAIVFFICLVVLSLLFWYGIYILMIERT